MEGWEIATSGAITGVITRFVISPFDVVKIRLQLQGGRTSLGSSILSGISSSSSSSSKSNGNGANGQQQQPKYRGIFQTMRVIVREEGIKGLWKGNMPAEYLYLFYMGIQFYSFKSIEVYLKSLQNINNNNNLNSKEDLSNNLTGNSVIGWGNSIAYSLTQVIPISALSGSIAATIATIATYPFDLLRTQYAVSPARLNTNVLVSLKNRLITNNNNSKASGATVNVKALYRGLVPTLLQIVPGMGIVFYSYERLLPLVSELRSNAMTNIRNSVKRGEGEPTASSTSVPFETLMTDEAIAGGLSGALGKLLVYPLDLARKRLQVQGPFQSQFIHSSIPIPTIPKSTTIINTPSISFTQTIINAIRFEGGFRALFKGLAPALVKSVPSSAVTFLVYGQCEKFFLSRRGVKEE